MKNKIILIDANSLVYRAFFALPKTLATSSGQVTNAVYGFTSMLIKLLKEEKPDVVIAAFDRAAPTFRHETFEQYKAHREPTPNELISQFPLVKEVLSVLNIPVFEMDGFEADDILATLASEAEAERDDVIVVTGDKDAFQLVDDHIKVMTTKKGISDIVIYDREKVRERYGVTPEQFADYLALKGDTSDNIPGVPGVGEKTAAKLIQQFGSIENLLKNLDAVENKRWREMLSEHASEAELSKMLAVLDREVPIDVDFDECKLDGWDEEKIRALFSKLEFFTLLDRLLSQNKQRTHKADDVQTLDTALEIIDIASEEIFAQLASDIEAGHHIAVAIISTGVNTVDRQITSVALATGDSKIYTCIQEISGELFPQEHTVLPIDRVLSLAKPYLESKSINKTGHDLKRMMLALWNANIKPQALDFDTMIAAYLLNPERSDYPIDELAAINLGISVAADTERERLANEAIANFRLKPRLKEQLVEKDLFKLFEEVEMPLVPVLARMEHEGVGLDTDYLEDLSKEVEIFLENIESEIYSLAGRQFNINSPQQLGFILFDKLGLPTAKKTKTGYSTDANVLHKLVTVHPIAEKIIAYRELAKLKSTYIDALPKLINPKTGKLHTSFNQTVTTTGRLSSSNPNLQNIPVRTELGQRIREAFIPSNPGDIFMAADYSQIELRLLAHYSEEEALLEAFEADMDIHEATAMQVFGVLPEQVTSQMRRMAKVVNFGVLYGMSPFGLADRLDIPLADARNFINRYFKRLPKVEEFIKKTIEEATKKGYVETLLGRRRYIPELKSGNTKIRSLGERFAVNAPLQGSAADIIKVAMVRIDKQIEEENLQIKMVLQVHDELIFEVPEREREIAANLINVMMENAYPLKVRLKVETSIGYNWKEATK
ncbi:MAG: DNA polymerase I [Candidatus Aquicultor secundus]|nr:DNA polymerase I [Candidatus Aquicultor secundus]NCO65412.1 DNA polymerase I [Solirubrobacter sp.]OIO87071.1 MAG: DNA polymerase I [Candidatus Aquicultor secundus]PIX52912.1 MAG: DNA polymerase I [Candidatus Aquicultor secundus]